jgi:LL-diaminopimelate aminotransferase
MNKVLAKRLKQLPPYMFAEIEKIIIEKKKRGESIISLSIGDPDLPPPSFILDEFSKEAAESNNHNYSLSQGEPLFRDAVAKWYNDRFNVQLDPEKEVIALIGSKEGIANVARAFVNPGDCVLVPNPAYPVYANGSTTLNDGIPISMPLLEEHNFMPILKQVNDSIRSHKNVKMMYLNYPNNPTATVVTKQFLQEIVEFAVEQNIIICYDNAYSEITFDGYKAPSILEIDGAKEVAIEFNSCSKTFNMTGDRIGFGVGNSEIIEGLRKIKSNIDSGPPVYIQKVAAKALAEYYENYIQQHMRRMLDEYKERRDMLIKSLMEIGFKCEKPKGTFYVWLNCGEDSREYAAKLLEQGVVVTPGIGFGEYGENFVRFSITRSKEEIIEACERILRIY